jgi:hypothetical protein
MPDHSRPMSPSGQRSQTSDSWSMAVNAAPTRASVAGNVAGAPGTGLAWNTADVGPFDDGLARDGQHDRGGDDQDGVD